MIQSPGGPAAPPMPTVPPTDILRRLASLQTASTSDLKQQWRELFGNDIVTVLADGFEFEGRPYRSLSAIARAITGVRWNGWTFFGLHTRGVA